MNQIVQIITPDGKTHEHVLEHPIFADVLAKRYQKELPYDILACRMNHETRPLHTRIEEPCKLELLDMRDSGAHRIYIASLSFIYVKAIQQLFGKQVPVIFENSLSRGIYTTIRTSGIDRNTAKQIEMVMQEIVDADYPFIELAVNREEMISYFEENHLHADLRLVKSAPDIQTSKLYTLDGETEICFHDMVPSTGYIKQFEVRRYKNGMLLRFPRSLDPSFIPEYVEQKELYKAFAENVRWEKIAGVAHAADLNETIHKGGARGLILLSEALHEKRIAEIASEIEKSGKRFILIAGPSSSGKTTFAKRLCIQLRVLGLKPLYLGTDDYFKERHETPIGEDGEKDFESLEALDLKLFNDQMNALLQGEKVDLPSFDFHQGTKVFGKRITSIDSSQPIVMEGIHGLNPGLTNAIPEEEKYKIYISPLTQLNIDPHNRISTTDARLLRRIVRDNQFRSYPASETIKNWKKVRAGEEVNIFPYNDEADVFFNSHLLYELAILKKYALPLLEEIPQEEPAYSEARRLLAFLDFFVLLEEDEYIPNNSIMREFIGGGILV